MAEYKSQISLLEDKVDELQSQLMQASAEIDKAHAAAGDDKVCADTAPTLFEICP